MIWDTTADPVANHRLEVATCGNERPLGEPEHLPRPRIPGLRRDCRIEPLDCVRKPAAKNGVGGGTIASRSAGGEMQTVADGAAQPSQSRVADSMIDSERHMNGVSTLTHCKLQRTKPVEILSHT
jgi:hypothetical protein